MFSLYTPLRYCLVLALMAAAFSAIAKGQTISGTIRGTVLDQQGGILSGVGITATNTETGLAYPGVTDATRGLYGIPEVPPGIYRVKAQFSGFQPEEHYPVRVDVNRVTEEDFTMKIFVSSKVEVVASQAPMTDINMPTQGENFNQNQIRELPLLSRDINNLALLAPGVESVRTFSFASTLVPFAASGSWGRYNNFIVDSVSNNEPIFGGAATQFSNPDIFSDYAISTSIPKAEFGRDSGSTVNVITKSGSNKVHGTAFWFAQDNTFDAMTRADTAALLNSTPPSYEHKVGGTLGGPLSKHDTFFFVSYQYDRARADLSNVFPVIATVPTAAGLASLSAGPQSPALDTMLDYPSVVNTSGLGGDCFGSASNPCFPASSVSGTQFGSYLVPQGNLFDVRDHQASARIDRRINDSNDFYGRYLVDDLSTPSEVLHPNGDVAFSDLGTLPDSRSILRQRTQSALLDERYARASSLNEVRFSASRIAQGIGPYNLPFDLFNQIPSATIGDNFGGFGNYQGNFPAAGLEFTLGQDTSANVTRSNVFEGQDNFSLTHNRHFMKMGVDFVRTQSNIIDVPTDLGHYFYGIAGVTGGLQDFISAPPTPYSTAAVAVIQTLPDITTTSSGTITGQGPEELGLRESDEAVFFQDDFRYRPNVTVSVGLRYERFGQPVNGILSVNPSAASSLLPTSGGDFGPRFGIAWSPGTSRKTVFRGGYALMYDQMPLNIPLLMWQSAPISPQIAAVTQYGYQNFPAEFPAIATPQFVATNNYPYSPISWQALNAATVKGCSSTTGSQTTGFASPFQLQTTAGSVPLINCSTQDTVSTNLATPYTQTWSAGIQRELSRNMMFEVSYVGTKGTKLYQRIDLNPYQGWNTSCLTSPPNFLDSCLVERPNPNRGDITDVTNAGSSIYHGLQASLNSRTLNVAGNTLTFTAAYTWSHMIDTDSEIFGPGVRVFASSSTGTTSDILTALAQSPEGISNIEAITPFAQISPYANIPGAQVSERGSSSYDRRQRFVFSEIWGLPSPSSSRAARAFAGGWFVNGVGTVQSGQPFTPLNGSPVGACADAQGEGYLSNTRPDIGNPTAPAGSFALVTNFNCFASSQSALTYNVYTPGISTPQAATRAQAYSTARFVQVPLGTNVGGDAGRNILTGPGILDFDFALFKQFHWGEGKSLEFRWEVYDVFNHPIYGYLLGNVFSSNAQPTPGFAFGPAATPAAVTGSIPENTIDGRTLVGSGTYGYDFLSKGNMNTGNRTMQFGVHFTF